MKGLGQKSQTLRALRTYIAETCDKRQSTPLNPDRQTIQNRDYSSIDVNAH